MQLPRLDLYLTFWIFLWILLFTFKMVDYSPKILVLVAVIYTVYEVIILIPTGYYSYMLFNIITKSVAIALVINSSIQVLPAVVAVLVYLLYIYLNKQHVYNIYGAKAVRERAECINTRSDWWVCITPKPL